MKQVKFRLGIGEHDLNTKNKQINKFLSKGQTVKVVVMLVGRHQSYPERGLTFLSDLCIVGRKTDPVHKGRDVTMMVYPNKE